MGQAQALNHPLCQSKAVVLFLLAVAGCAVDYGHDSRFQNWLAAMEQQCFTPYGELPLATPAKRKEFMNLAYEAYYRPLERQTFANRLLIRYPNHRLTIGCLANAFPR